MCVCYFFNFCFSQIVIHPNWTKIKQKKLWILANCMRATTLRLIYYTHRILYKREFWFCFLCCCWCCCVPLVERFRVLILASHPWFALQYIVHIHICVYIVYMKSARYALSLFSLFLFFTMPNANVNDDDDAAATLCHCRVANHFYSVFVWHECALDNSRYMHQKHYTIYFLIEVWNLPYRWIPSG